MEGLTMKSLGQIFLAACNAFQRWREINEDFAILQEVIASEEDVERIKNLARADFNPLQIEALLRATLETDNPEVFYAVLEKCSGGNVNYRLMSIAAGGGNCSSVYESSLLAEAMYRGSARIATSLANNPATDLSFGHSFEVEVMGQVIPRSETLLEIAEEVMPELVDVIKARASASVPAPVLR
jgi:hypothetical protein